MILWGALCGANAAFVISNFITGDVGPLTAVSALACAGMAYIIHAELKR